MKPLSNSQKKKILNRLNQQYGIIEFPYLIVQFGKEKYRLYSGSLSKEELYKLDRTLKIENIGLYFAKEHANNELRLTLDGAQLFKEQITKNIIKLTKQQAQEWFKGMDLEIKSENAFKVLKYNNEIIGCGKSTGEKIANFMPKERRIR